MDPLREDCGNTADVMQEDCGPAADVMSECTPGPPYVRKKRLQITLRELTFTKHVLHDIVLRKLTTGND